MSACIMVNRYKWHNSLWHLSLRDNLSFACPAADDGISESLELPELNFRRCICCHCSGWLRGPKNG